MKKKDIIIFIWEFGKEKLSFTMPELENYLRVNNYTVEEISFAKGFVKCYFDELKEAGKYTIDPASYVSLLNYNEVQIAQKSLRFANRSFWVAIFAIILTFIAIIFQVISEWDKISKVLCFK
jgi:hypothetical protein